MSDVHTLQIDFQRILSLIYSVELYSFNRNQACNQALRKNPLGSIDREKCFKKNERNFKRNIKNEGIVKYKD